MTNQFGRVIDRSRQLAHDIRATPEAEREKVLAEVRVLWLRARIIRAGFAMAVLSALLAALLIITLFLDSLLMLGISAVLVARFVVCMSCLITTMLMFFWDINLSLRALKLELPPEKGGEGQHHGRSARQALSRPLPMRSENSGSREDTRWIERDGGTPCLLGSTGVEQTSSRNVALSYKH